MTLKKHLRTLFILCCLLASAAHAEHWQTVTGKEKFLTVEVDIDSIQPGYHEDIVFFKVRSDDHYDTISTKSVQASCIEYSMEVDQESVFNKAEQTTEHFDWQKNVALKSSPNYAQSRLLFWGYTQAFGNAIKLACSKVGNRAAQRLEAMEQEQCSLANPLYKVACAPYASWRANYKLYLSRSHDTIYNCGISEDRMTKQTGLLLKNVMRCQSESCGNQILETWIQKRGQDIATVIHLPNQPQNQWVAPTANAHLCSSLNEADQEIASIQSEAMFAKAKYVGCIKRETAKLHTGVDDVENVPVKQIEQKAKQRCAPQLKEWQKALGGLAIIEDTSIPQVEAEQLSLNRLPKP